MVWRSRWGRLAVWILRSVRGDDDSKIRADVAATGGDLEIHATDKLNAAIGTSAVSTITFYIFGILRSGYALAFLALSVAIVAYHLPDFTISRKAAIRRKEFDESLDAFVGLAAIGITGGSGINSAIADTAMVGNDWCFDALRQSIDESSLRGETVWTGFEQLGQEYLVDSLVETAGALSLAGTSGARVAETLNVRAEAGRRRKLSEEMTTAEKRSESMNIPVAMILLGWMGFIGYPAVAGLVGS